MKKIGIRIILLYINWILIFISVNLKRFVF